MNRHAILDNFQGTKRDDVDAFLTLIGRGSRVDDAIGDDEKAVEICRLLPGRLLQHVAKIGEANYDVGRQSVREEQRLTHEDPPTLHARVQEQAERLGQVITAGKELVQAVETAEDGRVPLRITEAASRLRHVHGRAL